MAQKITSRPNFFQNWAQKSTFVTPFINKSTQLHTNVMSLAATFTDYKI